MDSLEEQLVQLSIMNSRPLSPLKPKGSDITTNSKPECSKVAALVNNLQQNNGSIPKNLNEGASAFGTKNMKPGALSVRKVRPIVPPKPHKKNQNMPEVPQSSIVKQACEPLYSQRLQCLDNVTAAKSNPLTLQRNQPIYATLNNLYDKSSKVTLDNPAMLEQQLEALAHHKKQLEKKGLLLQHQEPQKPLIKIACTPKLSSASLIDDLRTNEHSNVLYSNMRSMEKNLKTAAVVAAEINATESSCSNVYSNVVESQKFQFEGKQNVHNAIYKMSDVLNASTRNNIYCNVLYDRNILDNLSPLPSSGISVAVVDVNEYLNCPNDHDCDIPMAPSPVSSSYSELRRATEICSKKTSHIQQATDSSNNKEYEHYEEKKAKGTVNHQQTYMNMNYNNEYSSCSPTLQSISQDSTDYYGYGSFSQGSSTYESIYEPINPRPSSQLSSQSSYLMYTPYGNISQISESGGGILSKRNSTTGGTSGSTTPVFSNDCSSNAILVLPDEINSNNQKKAEVDSLTDFLVHSMDTGVDADSYGICFKCSECVLGENSGCTAMDQIYHIACFTCSQCQINLQGKPFYALDDKPFCEYDYLQTLEKCSVCMKPILERILRATGKPYHPQCFTCIVCGNSLDGIPFTVDATNQNYCIADFHKKFAPRCCVCKEPIMPERGEEETVRVVALDRSFHFECYKCEDCCLLLSSEAEGRGCYPLDDHVLCKSCNAKRVQMLTNRMTTEL